MSEGNEFGVEQRNQMGTRFAFAWALSVGQTPQSPVIRTHSKQAVCRSLFSGREYEKISIPPKKNMKPRFGVREVDGTPRQVGVTSISVSEFWRRSHAVAGSNLRWLRR